MSRPLFYPKAAFVLAGLLLVLAACRPDSPTATISPVVSNTPGVTEGIEPTSSPTILQPTETLEPLAARVIWEAVLDYLVSHPESVLEDIRFCNIDRYTADLFYELARDKMAGASAD